jgi:hypothetical protein
MAHEISTRCGIQLMSILRRLFFAPRNLTAWAPLAGAFILASSALSQAQPSAKPKELSEASVLNEAQMIMQSNLLKMSKPFEVSGTVRFDGWFIVTDKIVFKSGAQLIFTRQALQNRRNFFVVTKEFISEDSNAPGLITYEQPTEEISTAKPGQGPTGAHGVYDGQSGQPGGKGETGTPGPKGYSGPSITITALSVPGSGPALDFRGAVGGEGGRGQRGGDGGVGAKGSPASQSLVDCKAGGGRGGNGGPGGFGGDGGQGGPGGDGGSVTIIGPATLLPTLTQKFRVMVAGGSGGRGGAPGSGGNGGPGGPGGQEARPYCGGGPAGGNGGPGGSGSPGSGGQSGTEGDFFVGAITQDQFAQIYK